MSTKDLLMAIAMESGEVVKPVIKTPEEALYSFEDAAYAAESRLDEIVRALALTESLEAVSGRYLQDFELTQASLESYTFEVHHLLNVSNLNIPTTVAVPSFESGEVTKTGVGQKVKNVIAAIMKWIKEKLAAIGAFFSRLVGRSKATTEKANVDLKAAEVKIDALKAKGVTEVGAAVPKKPEAPPAPAAKAKPAPAPAAKSAPTPAPAAAAPKAGGEAAWRGTFGKLPEWLIVDGRFSLATLEKITKAGEQGTFATLLTSTLTDAQAKDFDAFLKSNAYDSEWKTHIDNVIGGKTDLTPQYRASLDDLKRGMAENNRALNYVNKHLLSVQKRVDGLADALDKQLQAAGSDEALIAKLRSDATDNLRVINVGTKFINRYFNLLDKTYTLLIHAIHE